MSVFEIDEIARIVEHELGYPAGAIAGDGRRREFIRARAIAYSLMFSKFPGAPDWMFARALGRDRSTIVHYRKMIDREDPKGWPEYPRCAERVADFLSVARPGTTNPHLVSTTRVSPVAPSNSLASPAD